MIDRERLLKAVEFCRDNAYCVGCLYDGECGKRDSAIENDTLAVLRELEPVKPIDANLCDYFLKHTMGRCGHCKAPLPALDGLRSKFCWMCGRQVKWE